MQTLVMIGMCDILFGHWVEVEDRFVYFFVYGEDDG